ncbi:Uncharacterised protein [Weissella viridescens]|uniref:Uncharacterized protein n=1 Tax=Weissella viridescens TaxID=1629 RepID=A0A380P910_WEIVI|nr:Uncharacterised protein [Weissella viridescens]
MGKSTFRPQSLHDHDWGNLHYLGTYTDVLIATVKSQNKHILWQAEKIEALKKEQQHD